MVTNFGHKGHYPCHGFNRAEAGDEILALHPEWKGHLDVVVVEDITNETSWDSIFKGTAFDHVS